MKLVLVLISKDLLNQGHVVRVLLLMMLNTRRLILVVSLFLRLWSKIVILLVARCVAQLKLQLVDVVLDIFTAEPIYLHVISVWLMRGLNCKVLLLLMLMRNGVLAVASTAPDLSPLERHRPAAPSSIAVLQNLLLRHVIYEWGDWLLNVVVILIIVDLQRLNLHHVRVVIDATSRRLSFLALLVGLTLLLSGLSKLLLLLVTLGI